MLRTYMILVSDDMESVEKTRQFAEGISEGSLQVYTPEQWKDGLNSPYFRQHLVQWIPTLLGGISPLNKEYSVGMEDENILPFTSTEVPSTAPFSYLPNPPGKAGIQTMEALEVEAICKAIEACNGNLTEASKALGVGRATIYRKVKEFKIDLSRLRPQRRKEEAA